MRRQRPKKGLDFAGIWQASLGFYRIWVLHLGLRHRIIQELARSSAHLSARELAERLSLSEDAVEPWCDAACSLGVIERDRRSEYTLPDGLVPLLVDDTDSRFGGGLPSYLALRSLDFGLFDQFFRDGAVPLEQPHLTEASREGTRYDHIAFSTLVLRKEPALRRVLERGANVLDMGSGTGGWSLRLARSYPRSTFTGTDTNTEAIRQASLEAARAGLGNASFHSATEGAGAPGRFDAAYLGEVLYLSSERRTVLEKCRVALRKGGILVVCEGLREGGAGPRKPESLLVHAMQLDFALQGGSFFTRGELRALLAKSGFTKVRFHGAGGGLWFAVAQKS